MIYKMTLLPLPLSNKIIYKMTLLSPPRGSGRDRGNGRSVILQIIKFSEILKQFPKSKHGRSKNLTRVAFKAAIRRISRVKHEFLAGNVSVPGNFSLSKLGFSFPPKKYGQSGQDPRVR